MESSLNGNVKLVKKSKDEKKLLRKQLKASHTLLKHEGINTASLPTQVKRILPCRMDGQRG
uniref:Alkylated DNA repair protein AlkB homologue 8 N-terminal domain-containing protein n=1 Tax=Anguilla anguilla TaxID=7936 RepID=A0A0E9SBS6_ANGAN